MLITDQHPHNKNITVGLVGKPNVGKSSLINALLGIDLSIVTHKPQTTRNKFKCVYHIGERTEVVLVDTPGLHRSNKEINLRMNGQGQEAFFGADLILLMIDLSQDIVSQIKDLKFILEDVDKEMILLYTKCDLVEDLNPQKLHSLAKTVQEYFPTINGELAISVNRPETLENLNHVLEKKAKPGAHHFHDGSMSNKNMRFFAGEYIREQAFLLLKEELPYEIAVLIDEFKEAPDSSRVAATLLVNRPSQRAIVVGSKGSTIKEIGTRARHKLEELMDQKVHLNLHVKVSPRWFKNNFVLEEIGLPRVKQSARVWRKHESN